MYTIIVYYRSWIVDELTISPLIRKRKGLGIAGTFLLWQSALETRLRYEAEAGKKTVVQIGKQE